MNILIVNYEFPPIGAGGGKASQKIAEQLVEMGHTVRVVTSRPTQLYNIIGNFSLIAGIFFWIYLAYIKINFGKDISDHGFTLLGTLLLLIGFILRNTALTWELLNPIRGLKPLEFINGVEVRRVPVARKKQDYSSILEMGTFVLSATWYIMRSARDFKPDVVHVFFAIPDGPIGWVLKRTHKLPYIISLRGADVPTDEVKRFALAYKFLRPVFNALLKDADAVVSVSNGLRQHAQANVSVPIKVVSNAIDLSVFAPALDKQETDVTRLLYVGRLAASKSPTTLIETIARLRDMDTKPFMLELVGEGDQRPLLEKMVVENKLSKYVIFSGWIGHPDLIRYYQNADIFVTTTIWEGMPNTVLEAMACGLPIVGTEAPGMNQLIFEQRNGYLVPTHASALLANRLQRLINAPQERLRMGKESRKIVQNQFSWEFISAQYAQVYESITLSKSKK